MLTHGPYRHTFGPEACELLAAIGQPLDPWQADGVDLMLALRDDGRYRHPEYVDLVSRQNGKGGEAEARVLAGLLLLGERRTLWSAHEYKTAIEAWERIRDLLLVMAGGEWVDRRRTLLLVDGILIKVNSTNGEESFRRMDTGARLRMIARTNTSGRGFSPQVVIIDEAFAYTAAQHAALLPSLSAAPNPQIIYLSSPPLDGVFPSVLWKLRLRGDPTAPRGPNDGPWVLNEGLCYRDWGAAGDLAHLSGVDLDDERIWAATNPALDIRVTRDWIRDVERKSMDDVEFARERLGIWPHQATEAARVIDPQLWRELAVTAERTTDRAFGVAVAADRGHTAIVGCGPRPSDGRLQLYVVAWRAGTGWVPDRIAELHQLWRPVATAVQDKGHSGTLLRPLADRGISPPADPDAPVRGDLAVPWAAEIALSYGLLVDALRQREITHIDEAPLNLAVARARTRPLGGGTAWTYDGEYDAVINAASMALWAWRTRAAAVQDVYDPVANVW